LATHSLPNRPEEEDGGKMSFFEHLAELRVRLIHACGAIVLGTFIGVSVSKHFLEFVAAPMVKALRAANLQDKLIFTHPAGYLYQIITLGLYLGIVIASPYVLYQIWLFVAPGLYRNERKAVAGFVISSVLLFLCGIVFAYYVILPYLLKFLVNFQTAGAGLSALALRHRNPSVPLEKFSLRDPDHYCSGCCHYAYSGRPHDVSFYGANDRPLSGQHCRFGGRGAEQTPSLGSHCRGGGLKCGARQVFA